MLYRRYHYFGGVIPLWEWWLNRMCRKGYRITEPGKLSTEFMECAPDAWEVRVEYLAEMSLERKYEHRQAWESMGYQVWYLRVVHPLAVLPVRINGCWIRHDSMPTPPERCRDILILQKPKNGVPFVYRGAIEDKKFFLYGFGRLWYGLFGLFGFAAVCSQDWIKCLLAFLFGFNTLRYLLGHCLIRDRYA